MRHHPLTILFRFVQLIKNSFFIVFLLFILRRDSDFWLFTYGRIAFLIYVVLRIAYIIVSWFKETYTWENQSYFKVNKGIFVTQTSTVPFNKIQNVTQRVSFLHKLFGVTSITFETATEGEHKHLTFDVLSKIQAERLTAAVNTEKRIEHEKNEIQEEEEKNEKQTAADQQAETRQQRIVHFTPAKKDLWKASFTSLSFLAIIPIVGSLYDNVQPFLPDVTLNDVSFLNLFNETGMIVLFVTIAVVLAISIGVIRTFIRYGKYEISSSDSHIFIHRGVLNESFFTIEKKKIQGIEIKQSLMKRLFGLAEVKIVSASGLKFDDNDVQVNSLYPFLPMEQAFRIIEELLPDYRFNPNMIRLPKVSLWIKLLRPSWLWIIATIALIYFKPKLFNIEQSWWILSLLLLIAIVVNRILDYVHTKYSVSDDQLQWWHGGLWSQLFMTKRTKVIEVAYSQSLLQKKFKLFSIKTKNRSNPVRVDGVNDVPVSFVDSFERWYKDRKEDITIL